MRIPRLSKEAQFKSALIFTQTVGLLQALVFLLLIGPGKVTDTLTILIMLSQAPISILSFGVLYNYVVGNRSFGNWKNARFLIAPIGCLSPLLAIPLNILPKNTDMPWGFILFSFCFASVVNSIGSIKIVQLACVGFPNWFASQSAGNGLAVALGCSLGATSRHSVVGFFLIAISLFQYFLIERSARKALIHSGNLGKREPLEVKFENMLYQIIRSLSGYFGPMILLISISKLAAGAITILAVINKISQSVVNLTANTKVHTRSNDSNASYYLESIAVRYILMISVLVIASSIYFLLYPHEHSEIVKAVEFWILVCILEIILGRLINLRQSTKVLRISALISLLSFFIAFLYLDSNPSIINFYLVFSYTIVMSSIFPALRVLHRQTQVVLIRNLFLIFCLSFSLPLTGYLVVFAVFSVAFGYSRRILQND